MRSRILALILLPTLSLPAFAEAGAENFEVPPSSVDAVELNAIRDRLMTGLFFRGELADGIIEAGLHDRIVKLTGRETRSEVRLALLDWIKKNPEEAAKLYFYIKGRSPAAARPPEVIDYKTPHWEINPNFLGLVQGLSRTAKDSTVSDEEMNLVAQRLFGSLQAPPEAYTPWMPGGSGGGARGAGSAAGINYADYKLNPASVERESRALGGWFDSVRSALEAESGNNEKSAELDRSRGLFNETFSLYRNFVVALSGLKGRTRITEKEAGGLEEFRRSLRKNLGGLEALYAMRRINKRAGALPAGAPGAKILGDDARRIEEAFQAFLSDLEKDPESFKSAVRRLYALNNASDFWLLRYSAHGRLWDLKSRMDGRGFSCVLDRIIFGYLSRFCPGADYVRLAAAQAESAKAISVSLEGVAAGDYRTAAVFSDGGKKPLMQKISEAEAEARRIEAYSRFNRRLQFLFWDVFVNPFGLEPGPKGLAAVNKLQF
ncbi:MAG: hypothetical protein WCK76_11605 [Elusimicrobiota bacterium]